MWKNRILAAAGALAAAAVLTLAIVKLAPAASSRVPAPAPAPSPTEQATPPKEQTAAPTEQTTPPAEQDGIYEAMGMSPDTPVVRLGSNYATADMYVYWLNNNCYYWNYMMTAYLGTPLDLHGVLPSGSDASEFIHTETIDTLKQQLVLENLAAEYGVTLTEEDLAGLEQQHQQIIANFGDEETYRAELAKIGVSMETYERILSADYLYAGLAREYETPGSKLCPSDEELLIYANQQEYVTVDHLLFMTIDEKTSEALSEEEIAAKRQQAEELLGQLRDSSDPVALFKELADRYSEDPGREAYPDGYTFTHGTMTQAFEDASYALEENEISDLVQTEYGIHILLRKPLDEHEAIEAVRGEYFDTLFQMHADTAQATVEPVLDSVDIAAVYDALQAAQVSES